MLPIQLPAEQARLVLPLVRAAAQDQGVLLPDAATGQVETCVLEGLAEVQPLRIGMEHINGCIPFHVLLHVDEGAEQELIKFIIRHIVVLDFPGRFFHIYIVRRIRQHQIGFLAVHQPCVGFRQRGIAADDTVFPQEPDIPCLGHSRLFQFSVHIEVIFFHLLVVDFRKELLHFRRLKACQIYIEIDALQIDDEVGQELFVPGAGDFIERDIKGLDLVFVFNMDDHALHFFIAQFFQHSQALMPADDGHIIVDDNGFHIAELLDGVLDLLIFLVTGLQLLPGVICRRLQLADGQDFPFHIRCLHTLCPFWMPQRWRLRTRSDDASGNNSARCPVTASFPGRWFCIPSPVSAWFQSACADSHS